MMETPDSVQVFSDKYLENISDAFKTLYNEEQLSDVTIYCREGSLKAHKLILAASSPYFCKIFRENRNEFPILILHGTSLNQMKNLIDLLYNGITEVKNNDIEALYTLVREFEIKGVNFGPKSSSSNVRLEMRSSNVSPEGSHNRDTRFKGQKRVAVDYTHEEYSQTYLPSTSREYHDEIRVPKKANLENNHIEEPVYIKRETASPALTERTILSSSDITSISDGSLHIVHTESKLTAWAKKQRKFKCNLCPSSFKRSSHLSRHQLVHTGERPFSCDKCDKAFSRHDKLKNHMRKAHEYIPDAMYEKIDNDVIDSDIESNNMIYGSPNQNGADDSLKIEDSTLPTPKNSPPLFTISHISSILEDSFVNPPKKARGRPRKYPPPTASPAVLNSNQELPVSNDIKENEQPTSTRRLREKRNVNNNEDVLISRMAEKERLEKEKGLFCQICDKPFIYQGRLNLHMRKIHGIIDYSQKEESKPTDAQKDNIGNISTPDVGVDQKALITISSVCSLNDINKEKFEGKDMGKEQKLGANNSIGNEEGILSNLNLTYEQLRELLPKECTLQPIIEVDKTDTAPSAYQKEDSSKPASKNINNESKGDNFPQGHNMFVISSLLQGDTTTPTEEMKEISDDSKESKKLKEYKIRKRKRKRGGIIRYVRAKKMRHQQGKSSANMPSYGALAHSFASNIEASTSHNRESQTSSFTIPHLSSAIEISIISTKEVDLPTQVPQETNGGEDLSITVIDKSAMKSQQDTNFVNSNSSYRSENMHETEKLLIEGNNPHFHSGDHEYRSGGIVCNSQEPQTNETQDSQLPTTFQNELNLPQKKRRGRPRKKLVPTFITQFSETNIDTNFMNSNVSYHSVKMNEPENFLIRGKDPHSHNGDHKSRTASIVCNSQELRSIMIQDSQIPETYQNEFTSPLKRKRGRPKKITNINVAPLVKRGRGRPRANVFPERPGIRNYNITNLPYGDLNYLTSQASTREEEEEAVMMEPLVEINMDQSEQSVDADSSQNVERAGESGNTTESSAMMEAFVIEPVVQITEKNVKQECCEEGICHENVDIREIENKIGLIGECTISVAN